MSSPFTPLQFTGISQYSTDFQSILTRAVGIAQIPVMQLTNQQTTIDSEETVLGNLSSSVSGLGSALAALGQVGQSGGLSATTTDSSVVSVTNSGASAPASYSITNVTSLAAPASERSASGYSPTQSVSSTGTMKLVYGSNTYTFTLAAGKNNVAGVRDAINALGAGVTASVLTTGGTSGDYVSLSTTTAGATTLKLLDDPAGAATNVITSSNQGTNTQFSLNGIPVSTAATTVNNIIPGVTLKFHNTTATNETVSVNLSQDRSQIVGAMQSLVSAYNTLKTQVAAQFGTNGGPLSGNNVLYQIRDAMSSVVQYNSGAAVGNLANLGIEIGQDGKMSFNQDTFNSLSDAQASSAFKLLGSDTTGVGGLQKRFSGITDPVSGSIALQTQQWNVTSQRIAAQISTKNTQIAALQQTWNQRLQAADASVAKLGTQQSTLMASLTGLDYVSYGYNTNANTTKST